MEIKKLKQPYRRMAEYLAEINTCESKDVRILPTAFFWSDTDYLFWSGMFLGINPPITEEMKKHFPTDFDFSGEKVEDEKRYNFAFKNNMEQHFKLLDNPIIQNRVYTQLAKEGRFNELPDICEFSEEVELEVWEDELSKDCRKITGKFKGNYMDIHCIGWKSAQLPTPKIDFSEFKKGDVVEIELTNNEKRIGWFDYTDRNQVVIKTLQRKGNQVCNGGSCAGSKMLNIEKIKQITKIK
tara:strand:- start:367 stop:1086 length:720 start_codon:yes stop_codon:yes gene_type:complete